MVGGTYCVRDFSSAWRTIAARPWKEPLVRPTSESRMECTSCEYKCWGRAVGDAGLSREQTETETDPASNRDRDTDYNAVKGTCCATSAATFFPIKCRRVCQSVGRLVYTRQRGRVSKCERDERERERERERESASESERGKVRV